MSEQAAYPTDAAQVRDLICEMLRSQVDHGSSMDTGGGLGQADLWVRFGGVEFLVTVKAPRTATPGSAASLQSKESET